MQFQLQLRPVGNKFFCHNFLTQDLHRSDNCIKLPCSLYERSNTPHRAISIATEPLVKIEVFYRDFLTFGPD